MKFCPIMTIGFAPPNKGEQDNRTCKKDCVWYNEDEEVCKIDNIMESLQRIEVTTSDLLDITADTLMTLNSNY